MQQNTAEASATRARTQAAEEGELSEGEYEEDNVEGIAGSPRGGAVDYNDYRKSRPGPSNGALNQRQSSFERMAPDPLTGIVTLLSICMHVAK